MTEVDAFRQNRDHLDSVDTDFPDEADVSYEYGGDLKRRERTAGSDTTWYNWGAGYAVMGEEDGSGNLLRTYVAGTMAHIDGASAASGTYSYYWHDHLGSTRTLYDGAKAETASFDYAPYGDPLLHSHSAATTRLYTGHDWDPAAGLYFAPYRYYNPDLARWITRDPLGMEGGINLYAYCHGNPVFYHDPDGRNPIVFGGLVVGGGAVAGGLTALFFCGPSAVPQGALLGGGFALGGLIAFGSGTISGLFIGAGVGAGTGFLAAQSDGVNEGPPTMVGAAMGAGASLLGPFGGALFGGVGGGAMSVWSEAHDGDNDEYDCE